jgi:hypothetical protein
MLRTTDPRVSRRGLSALRNERNIAMTTTLEAIRKYQLQESLAGLRGLACRRLMLPIYTGQHAGSSAHASFSARVAAGISPPKHVGATRTAGQVAAVCPSPIDVACRHFATLNEAIRRRGARSAQREPGFARAVATKRQPARRHLGCWPRSWVWITLPGWSQPMWVDP